MPAGRQHLVQIHSFLVPVRLQMPVGVAGLRDRRVPQLPLHPPDVGTSLEEPGGVAVPHRVGLSVRELRGREQGSLDVLRERSIASDLPLTVREDQPALLVRPAVQLRLERHRFHVGLERLEG